MRLFSIVNLMLLLAGASFSKTSLEATSTEQATQEATDILNGRLSPHDRRYKTFAYAFQLMNERGAKMIVETGTARCGERNFGGDGGSTILFGDFATRHNIQAYSVDISQESVNNAQAATLNYIKNLQVVCADSVAFLKNFPSSIDFLYLDSFDYEYGNPLPSQWHHLKEIEAAYPKLTENSIVMIDDCDLPQGGKGPLVIQYLKDRGWKIAMQGYQVIMVKN